MPVIAEHDVRQAASRGARAIHIPDEAVVTPQAVEIAEKLGVALRRGVAPEVPIPETNSAQAIQRLLLKRSPRWVTPELRTSARPGRFTRLSFIGCGMVGAHSAHLAATADMTDEISLIDIVPGTAAATALDIEHSFGITGSSTRVRGSTSLADCADADAIIVTAGRPRSPGMTRGALREMNGKVIRDIAEAIASHAPNAVVIVVTNPLDEMSHEMWRTSGLPREQVIGMAGTLDSSRFRVALAQAAQASPADVSAVALGSHGSEMVPILSTATIKGRPAASVLSSSALEGCVSSAVNGGASVVELRKTGSASIAPAHSIIELLDAMRGRTVEPVPVSVLLTGQYGIEDVFLGVRAQLAFGGVRNIVVDPVSEAELDELRKAAEAVRSRTH
ncbi:malate dehydrogenase [Brevibacterium sp. FAM 27836]|uniref:malate dehydrogenase n=1 Tax=Brevibacterium sp. FAM 27836 TaxID=3446693 RepID=UPI003F51626A